MKRAAILILAIATLVLIGSPSAPLLADSNPATKSASGPAVLAPTGDTDGAGAPSGSGGGGTSEGDADGLSGLKAPKSPNGRLVGSGSATDRYVITMKMWWRFMLWIR